MKRFMCLSIVYFPILLLAQNISWTKGLSWEQIKQKAKQANKYIFVDCYATWCVPCKKMDKEIYVNEGVARFINENFIPVKVQMDSSKHDSEETKSWYRDAHLINRTYHIVAYPSFLFFSPQGAIVHNDFGYKNVDELIELLTVAKDPKKQYYSLVARYKSGKLAFQNMPSLAYKAKDLKDKDLANQIAKDYLNNFLYRQKNEILYKAENISFIMSFTQSSTDKGFLFIYKNRKKINSLMNQEGYSEDFINYIISKEEITPSLNKADSLKLEEPNWTIISAAITRKYNKEFSARNIVDAKIKWYNYIKDWKRLAQSYFEKFEKYGVDTSGFQKYTINNVIWDVFFMRDNDMSHLTKAVKWMELILDADPYATNNIDTYANLLYKVGRVSDAIKFESIAAKLEPNNNLISEALENMKNRKPTHIGLGAVWNEITLSNIAAKKYFD